MPRSKKKAATKKSSAKKASGAAAEPTMSKAAFVRSQPKDMPADEVIEKAKAVGITLTAGAVYSSRSKAKGKKKGATKSSTSPKKKNTAKPSSGTTARGDKKERVLEVAAEHPTWPKSKIAEKVGCTANYVYSVINGAVQGGGSKGAAPPHANGALAAFYRAVKGIGGVAKAKELIANIEAFQNA